MAISATHKNTEFGVGDRVKVTQRIKEGEKERLQIFEGMVIGIKGHGNGKSFTVRRVGAAQVGIERIFPLSSPTLESVAISKEGKKGARRAKLYYTRDKSKREIDKIYSRSARRSIQKAASKAKAVKKASKSTSSSKKK